jgi:hypothetical protein
MTEQDRETVTEAIEAASLESPEQVADVALAIFETDGLDAALAEVRRAASFDRRKTEAIAAIAATLRNYGPAYYGDDTRATEIAKGWNDCGFNVDDVVQWCAAGCWNSNVATEFEQASIGPTAARRACQRYRDAYGGNPRLDPMRLACDGELDTSEIVAEYKPSR